MTKIKLRYLALISDITGKRYEELIISEGSTLSDLLDILFNTYPKLKEIRSKVNMMYLVNGRRRNSNYILHDGDEVALMIPPSGG